MASPPSLFAASQNCMPYSAPQGSANYAFGTVGPNPPATQCGRGVFKFDFFGDTCGLTADIQPVVDVVVHLYVNDTSSSFPVGVTSNHMDVSLQGVATDLMSGAIRTGNPTQNWYYIRSLQTSIVGHGSDLIQEVVGASNERECAFSGHLEMAIPCLDNLYIDGVKRVPLQLGYVALARGFINSANSQPIQFSAGAQSF